MTSRRLLFIFLGVLTLWRLIAIGHFDLSPDEAYYKLWSDRMDISYYSKGPGVATAIWIGTHIFGDTALGIRLLSPLLGLGTSLLLYFFGRRLYGESIAIWAVVALNCIPIFHVGSLVMTIDPLSIFFWTAALYTFWLALENAPGLNRWWPITGALIGLGFLCKWTNAMQLLSIFLLLFITQKYRRELLRPGFWVMLGVFALFTIPPIIWNSQHDWITVSHLSARGGFQKATQLSISEFGTFLAAHFGVYSPLIFGGMLVAIWWGCDRARAHFKPRFLLAFALPLLVLYFLMAFREAGEANWTAPASISLGLLATALWHDLAKEKAWARRFSFAALALGLFLSLVILNTDNVRRLGITWPYKYDPSSRLRGWETSAEVVQKFREGFEESLGEPVFMIADKYQTAAILAFHMDDPRVEGRTHPPVYIPESQAIENQFSFWRRYDELTDFREVAKDILAAPLPAGVDPALKQALETALAAYPDEKASDTPEAKDALRELVRTMRAIRPDLPLDEAYVEQQGVSLFAGRTALYVTDRAENKPPSSIKKGFDRSQLIACIDIKRRGLPLRQLRIFACYGYKTAGF